MALPGSPSRAPPHERPPHHRLWRDGLTPGGARRFDVQGVAVAVVRIDDEVYVIGDRCTHEGVAPEGEMDKVERLLECWKPQSVLTGDRRAAPAPLKATPVYPVDVRSGDVVLTCRQRTVVARSRPTGRARRSDRLDRLAARHRRCRDPSRQRSRWSPTPATFARKDPHRNEHADGRADAARRPHRGQAHTVVRCPIPSARPRRVSSDHGVGDAPCANRQRPLHRPRRPVPTRCAPRGRRQLGDRARRRALRRTLDRRHVLHPVLPPARRGHDPGAGAGHPPPPIRTVGAPRTAIWTPPTRSSRW